MCLEVWSEKNDGRVRQKEAKPDNVRSQANEDEDKKLWKKKETKKDANLNESTYTRPGGPIVCWLVKTNKKSRMKIECLANVLQFELASKWCM